MQGLEYVSCEERLKDLELLSWEKRSSEESQQCTQIPEAQVQRGGIQALQWSPEAASTGETQKTLLLRVTDLWHRLPREITGSLFLVILKSSLDMTLIELMGWTGWHPTSANLWFCDICPKSEIWRCNRNQTLNEPLLDSPRRPLGYNRGASMALLSPPLRTFPYKVMCSFSVAQSSYFLCP